MIDLRNWDWVQYVRIGTKLEPANCKIEYDIQCDELNLYTTKPIKNREPLRLSLPEVMQLTYQVCGRAESLVSHYQQYLIPNIKNVNDYADTEWENLTTEEQRYILQREISNINEKKYGIEVRERENEPGNLGVFTTKVIPKNVTLTWYAGKRFVNEDDMKEKYVDDEPVYVFKASETLFIDAVDPRKSNFSRFINCPGICERPNCKVVYHSSSRRLLIKTCRILVEGEELTFSYGSTYHFPQAMRTRTNNDQIRRQYNSRGIRNDNIRYVQKRTIVESKNEPSGVPLQDQQIINAPLSADIALLEQSPVIPAQTSNRLPKLSEQPVPVSIPLDQPFEEICSAE